MAEKLRLKDYQQPSYWTTKTDLVFELFADYTLVSCTTILSRNLNQNSNDLILQGDGQELLEFQIDGKTTDSAPFLKDKNLHLNLTKNEHTLFIKNKIYPKDNKSFEGLYCSNNKYFTQCEAEGFRKITYYQDRPDVLSKFTTTVTASGYPVLLSNGNLVSESKNADSTTVVWEDPFPKPAYLFALVAGHFDKITDSFKTRSGTNILLEVYVDEGLASKAQHAMKSLKESMKWDEDRYDLEYDLDRYMIVAANDFNSGAMENKGLNIFNTKYVLADVKSATDTDFYNIQSVVAHEYFHNWTGNRVTCRDWFQLSLKEGLTVYRDQEFSSDLNSRGVKRIDDVMRLRTSQFSEDAGGNSHPVRPSEALNISNFYTATIYEKGAELIRMIETLIGRDKFKLGMKKYFELFDGKAVTTEDFCFAMSEASGRDLTYFQRWYSQKGTPKLEVKRDLTSKQLKLNFKQITSPLLLPVSIGLIRADGTAIKDIEVVDASFEIQKRGDTVLLEITKDSETITFSAPSDCRISFLRDFSAPIILKYDPIENEVYDLAAFDTNSFSKWEAIQQLITSDILKNIGNLQRKQKLQFNENLIKTYQKILRDPILDTAYTAKLFSFPEFDNIKLEFDGAYPLDEILETLTCFKQNISLSLNDDLFAIYNNLKDNDNSSDRSLKNCLLKLLCSQKQHLEIASNQFKAAKNMTDQLAALNALKDSESSLYTECLHTFYKMWSTDSLVYTKYLSTIFTKKSVSVLEDIQKLSKDTYFQNWNPNHNYAAYGALAANPTAFHDKSGLGYQILAKRILELDQKNPHVAARIANCFSDYKKLDSHRQTLLKKELEAMLQQKLSSNTYEIIHNSLH